MKRPEAQALGNLPSCWAGLGREGREAFGGGALAQGINYCRGAGDTTCPALGVLWKNMHRHATQL